MSTLLERLEYGFDRDSRRRWRRRALATGEDDAYGYDGLSQVLNAARGNLNMNATAIGGVPAEDEAWDYDPTGNWRGYRVEEDGAVTLDQQRVHDKGNRLTQIEGSAEPVLVDRAGRMRQVPPDAGGDWSEPLELVWDAWSRLVEVRQGGSAVGSYAYDGLSRRTTRTTGGVTLHSYYSDAWRPLEERQEGEDTAALQYYWGARHRDDLVRRDRATTSGGSLDETRYVLMDYFSPAAITDEGGSVTERYAFSAFGVRRVLNPDFTPRTDSECNWEFAFQGQFLDSESGFLDYGYRYYSPFLGRWTCKDPIGEKGGANLYAMIGNSTVNTTDLLGLQVFFTPMFEGTPVAPFTEMTIPRVGPMWTGPELTPPVPAPMIPPSTPPSPSPSTPTDPYPVPTMDTLGNGKAIQMSPFTPTGSPGRTSTQPGTQQLKTGLYHYTNQNLTGAFLAVQSHCTSFKFEACYEAHRGTGAPLTSCASCFRCDVSGFASAFKFLGIIEANPANDVIGGADDWSVIKESAAWAKTCTELDWTDA